MALLSSGYSVTLGIDVDTGQEVRLAQKQRLRGFYGIGIPGSGKTTLLIDMILQDIKQGMGVCFIDVHGDATDAIIARIPEEREKDVILIDPLDKNYAFGFNHFQCDPTDEVQVSRTVSSVSQVFAKLFTKEGDFSTEAPNMELTLRNAAYTLIDNLSAYRTTMSELPLLIDEEYARERLIRNINDDLHSEALRFWKRYHGWKMPEQYAMAGSTSRALNRFLSNVFIQQIVGQSITTLDFRKIMDSGKILLVKLPRRDEEITGLSGNLIIGQMTAAAFSREDTPEDDRVPFMLYVDEFQHFATPDFATLLAEGRKFKVGTHIFHQNVEQLDEKSQAAARNAANMAIFQLSGKNAQEFKYERKANPKPGKKKKEPIWEREGHFEHRTIITWEPEEKEREYTIVHEERERGETQKKELDAQLRIQKKWLEGKLAELAAFRKICSALLVQDKFEGATEEVSRYRNFTPPILTDPNEGNFREVLPVGQTTSHALSPYEGNERFYTYEGSLPPSPAETKLKDFIDHCSDQDLKHSASELLKQLQERLQKERENALYRFVSIAATWKEYQATREAEMKRMQEVEREEFDKLATLFYGISCVIYPLIFFLIKVLLESPYHSSVALH